jgi:hypothetical protein
MLNFRLRGFLLKEITLPPASSPLLIYQSTLLLWSKSATFIRFLEGDLVATNSIQMREVSLDCGTYVATILLLLLN